MSAKLLGTLAALVLAQSAAAGTVNGTLVRKTVAGVQPAGNVAVTLKGTSQGRAVQSGRVFTDLGGQFWFYDMPPGTYELEIWRNGHGVGQPEKCSLQVTSGDLAVGRPLRLQSSPARREAEIRPCSAGLDHLYSR